MINLNENGNSIDLIDKFQEYTKEILERRLQREPQHGGYTSLTVGPPGAGKTSHILFEAKLFMEIYPDDIIIFRNSKASAAQFNRIGKNYRVFVEGNNHVKFRNLKDGTNVEIPFDHFNDFDELIDKDTGLGLMKPRQLNVVYFKNDYTWIDFLSHLRRTIGWKVVCIDEIEDIIPLNPSKGEGEKENIQHKKNILFSNEAKEIRKGLTILLCDTQAEDEIDWRFKRKVNFTVYLRGARVSPKSRIYQSSVNNLAIGECYIDWEYRKFGKTTFSSFPPVDPVFEVIM